MTLFASIIVGTVAGYLACKLTGSDNKGLLVYLFLGILGGLVGDWLFELVHLDVWLLELHEWLAAILPGVVGACICLWVFSKMGSSNGGKKKK